MAMSIAILCTLFISFGPTLLTRMGLRRKMYNSSKVWHSQPCVGIKDQPFAWTRAMLKSIWQTEAMISEGYAKVRTSIELFTTCSEYVLILVKVLEGREIVRATEHEYRTYHHPPAQSDQGDIWHAKE